MAQQPFFTPDAAAEADHFAVASDHAVTGNDKRNPVFVVGVAHGAKGLRAADALEWGYRGRARASSGRLRPGGP